MILVYIWYGEQTVATRSIGTAEIPEGLDAVWAIYPVSGAPEPSVALAVYGESVKYIRWAKED